MANIADSSHDSDSAFTDSKATLYEVLASHGDETTSPCHANHQEIAIRNRLQKKITIPKN